MTTVTDLNSLDLLDQEDLLRLVKGMMSGGVVLSFLGKRTATEIGKRVRPRVTRRLADFSAGTPEEQSRNYDTHCRSASKAVDACVQG